MLNRENSTMSSDDASPNRNGKKVVVKKNGPYIVKGGIPLVRKTQVVSEK
jgi:hypothetical protein